MDFLTMALLTTILVALYATPAKMRNDRES